MTQKDFYSDLKDDLQLEGDISSRIVGGKLVVTNANKPLSVRCKRNNVTIDYDGETIEDQYYFTGNMVILTLETIIKLLK